VRFVSFVRFDLLGGWASKTFLFAALARKLLVGQQEIAGIAVFLTVTMSAQCFSQFSSTRRAK